MLQNLTTAVLTARYDITLLVHICHAVVVSIVHLQGSKDKAATLELQCSCGHERLLVPTKLVHGTTDCGANACVMMLQETQVEELQQSMEYSSAMAAQAQHGRCGSIVGGLTGAGIMANMLQLPQLLCLWS